MKGKKIVFTVLLSILIVIGVYSFVMARKVFVKEINYIMDYYGLTKSQVFTKILREETILKIFIAINILFDGFFIFLVWKPEIMVGYQKTKINVEEYKKKKKAKEIKKLEEKKRKIEDKLKNK